MWQRGMWGQYRYEAQVFDEPSRHGIAGGRISRLRLWRGSALVANFDRGWDIRPTFNIRPLLEWLEA